jgi:hypothetical protein
MSKRDEEYQKQFSDKNRTHTMTIHGKFAGYFYNGKIRIGGKLRTPEEVADLPEYKDHLILSC